MSSIKNIAIVGASGTVGTPILNAILNSKKFNVTVLSRVSSEATFPKSARVVHVDFNSLDSVAAALKGQDTVVSAVGAEGTIGQTLIFDAAISVGVKRFIPSEFGGDIGNPKAAALPVFGRKLAVRKYIEEKVQNGADITYTYVINGPFVDWGIKVGFLVNWLEGKPRIFDGGDRPFSTTTLESVGLAVVGVLSHPEETKNKTVYVHDTVTTQNRLIEIAKRVAPEKKWEPTYVDSGDVFKAANEKLAKGQFDIAVIYEYLYVAVFGDGYGAKMEKVDNQLLGVPGKTEEDIQDIWKKLLV